MVDIKELKKIADCCRKLGIISLKTSEIEINLSALPPPKKLAKESPEETNIPQLSEEEILLWSSAGLNEGE